MMGRTAHRTDRQHTAETLGQTDRHTHRAQRPASPAGYFSMVVAPETQQNQESPEFCSPPPGILPITCGQGPGDCEPRRLVGLANIIGNLTNILPALRLCHIIQGQHLRIRAINPRVLEQTNNMESHGCAREQHAPRVGIGSARAGAAPPNTPGRGRDGAAHRGVTGGRSRDGGVALLPSGSQCQEHSWGWLHGITEWIFKGHPV